MWLVNRHECKIYSCEVEWGWLKGGASCYVEQYKEKKIMRYIERFYYPKKYQAVC
jgi:hypothetical protein